MDSDSLFEGRATNQDYAIEMAESSLGKIVGRSSSGGVNYSNVGWCKLEWLESFNQIESKGLPSITLPSKFKIVKINR